LPGVRSWESAIDEIGERLRSGHAREPKKAQVEETEILGWKLQARLMETEDDKRRMLSWVLAASTPQRFPDMASFRLMAERLGAGGKSGRPDIRGRDPDGRFAAVLAWSEPLEEKGPVLASGSGSSPAALPGRNDPCLCGSGKKFKKCCG